MYSVQHIPFKQEARGFEKFISVFNFSFMLQELESILIQNYGTETDSREISQQRKTCFC